VVIDKLDIALITKDLKVSSEREVNGIVPGIQFLEHGK